MLNFARRRKGFPRLRERLQEGEEARIVAFGGSLTRDVAYLAPLIPTLRKGFPAARIETARRALPGFSSASAAFRTESVVEMKPDVAIVEFAIHDTLLPPATIGRAVEGMVRQLRANDPERDIAFVYFGGVGAVESGKMVPILDAWERVAEYYGIPSFDGIALSRRLVESGKAVWFEPWPGRRSWVAQDRTVVLTHDGNLQTAAGGNFLGEYIAQALLGMLNVPAHTARDLPPPLDPGNWEDARWIPPSSLACEGWTAGPLPEPLRRRWCAAYFDECVAGLVLGAVIRVGFTGRGATLWTLQTSGTLTARLDGRPIPLDLSGAYDYRWHNLIIADESRPHVIEIAAGPATPVIAGIDLLGTFEGHQALGA